jgi:hypothetical protein
MASLNNVRGDTLTPQKPKPRKEREYRSGFPTEVKEEIEYNLGFPEVKKKEVVIEATCTGCGYLLVGRELRAATNQKDPFGGYFQSEDDYLCRNCFKILTAAAGSMTARQCLEKIEEIDKAGFLVILKSGSFGDNNGNHITVEFGDIFKINRAGVPPANRSTYEHSKARFSIDINVGPVPLTLWPREVAAMPFATIMKLQSEGDYQMAYLSQDDQEGYWTLTPEAKQLVRNTFGDR